MPGKDNIMEILAKKRMGRQETLKRECSKEYKVALQIAVTSIVPHVYSPSQYRAFSDHE